MVGSLREWSMMELGHSAAMEQWRALMPTDCISCAAYSVCHGGCRAIQELRPDRRDPLRHEPLDSFAPPVETRKLPASGPPRVPVRLREESFSSPKDGRFAGLFPL
jgi:hypothetical protein